MHYIRTEAMSEAKYLKIYNWLSDQIKSKVFQPGDKIPNETEIAEMFNVHRMTVRHAIDKLVSSHMLIRTRGKGTFLLSEKEPILTRSLAGISSYHDDIVKAGLEAKYKTLEAMIKDPDTNVIEKLGLESGEQVIYIKRLMLANEIPLVLEYCYLPEKLFSDILDKNLNSILYKVIQEEYGMKLMHSSQEIGAILPDERERKFLKIGNNCACIWVEGIVYNDSGRAVEYTRSVYRGDKYKFRCDIGNYIIQK
jgi:DNA-binding GntR family transcriptional regulator